MRFTIVCLFASLACLLACNDEQLYNNAVLETSIQVTTQQINENLKIESARLRVASINMYAKGNSGGTLSTDPSVPLLSNDLSLTEGGNPQPLKVSVARGEYDSVRMTIKLIQDDYALLISEPRESDPDEGGLPDSSDDEDGDSSGDDDSNNDGGSNDNAGEDPVNDGGETGNDEGGNDNAGGDPVDNGGESGNESSGGNNGTPGSSGGSVGNGGSNAGGGAPPKNDKDDKKKDDKKKNQDDKKKDKDKDKKDDKKKGKKGNSGGRTNDLQASTVDLEHFFEHAKPALFASLIYTTPAKKIHVIVALDNFALMDFQNTQRLSITDLYGNKAKATIDVASWFSNITNNDLENSVLINYGGESVLLIHRQFNANLFLKITERFSKSFALAISTNAGK